MGFSSLRGRIGGLTGRKKVALLMTAAALGVAAATPWLFDDGATQNTTLSVGRNGGPRPRSKPASPVGQRPGDKPASSSSASPLPVPGLLADVFDGRLQQTAAAPGGGEAGPGASLPSGSLVPPAGAELTASGGAMAAAASAAAGGAGLGGGTAVRPADFGGARGFVAEPKR